MINCTRVRADHTTQERMLEEEMTHRRIQAGDRDTIRVRLFPPMMGGAQKTGWEALDKWVGATPAGSSVAAEDAPAASGGPSAKTGWEALDKWVGGGEPSAAGSDAGAAAGGGQKTGWEALDKWVGGGEPSGANGSGAAPQQATDAGSGVKDTVGDLSEKAGEAVGAVSSAADEASERVSDAAKGGGGLMGFLRRLFGGQ